MAKKVYQVIRKGSFGNKGDLVELDIKGGLNDRQKVMLAEYEKPVVKADDSEAKALSAKVTELEGALEAEKAKSAELEAELVELKKEPEPEKK